LGKVLVLNLRPQRIELNREVGVLHLTGKDFRKAQIGARRAADAELITGNEQRREEGKTLNVVPVGVSQQNGAGDGSRLLREQMGAQQPGSGTTVEYETRTGISDCFRA